MKETPSIHQAFIRADVWRLLALGFDRPTPESITAIISVSDGLSANLRADHLPLHDQIVCLRNNYHNVDMEALESLYHRLFSTTVLASSYEGSYHRTERGAIIGDISAFYQAFGLAMTEQSGPPDSMKSELALLSWLALKEAFALEHHLPEELEITRDATRKFLGDHLARWAPCFTTRLQENTDNPIYLALSQLLLDTINLSIQEFNIHEIHPLGESTKNSISDTLICPAAGAT